MEINVNSESLSVVQNFVDMFSHSGDISISVMTVDVFASQHTVGTTITNVRFASVIVYIHVEVLIS